MRRQSKRELERMKQLYPDLDYARPMSRADCQHGPHAERPCPFVSCKHHLYLDVNERNGNIKLNMPHIEVWEMPDRLALAMVAAGFAVSQDGARGPEVEMAVLAPPANADARPRGSKRIPAGK